MNQKPHRLRRWLARVLILCVVSCIALLIGELVVRFFFADRVVLFPRYHTGAQYGPYHLRRLRPGTTFRHTSVDGSWLFTTNAQGFRDTRDYPLQRTPGVRRVLCMGDSHTQGFEVRQEHTYAALLGRFLERHGVACEVMNCGISGLGTAEELAFLENEGFRYAPDAVVLGWFGNDLDDNIKSGLFKLKEGHLAEQSYEHVPGVAVLDALNRWPPLRWLSEHSYLYSMAFNNVWEWRKGRLSQERREALTEYAQKPSGVTGDYSVELAAALLARMHTACVQRGIPLVLLEIPSRKSDDDFESDVPPALFQRMRSDADVFLTAEETLGGFRGVVDLFVPHGQHHISETTHLLLAHALEEKLRPILANAQR